MNIVTAIAAMSMSVAAAFRDSGGLNAGTPSEIASTPVIAVQPFAKAVRNANVLNDAAVPNPADGSTGGGWGVSPVASRQSPDPMSASMMLMNANVGAANSRPDSRMPRRLPIA